MEVLLETLGKVGFEWRMGLFSLINFLIVFWILKKLFFSTVTDTINQREKKIKEGIENFQKAKTELEMAEKNAREIIESAKKEASEIIEAAHQDGKEYAQQMKDKTKEDVAQLIAEAKESIAKQKAELTDEVKKDAAKLVIAVARKVLGKKVDDKLDQSFIEKTIKDVG